MCVVEKYATRIVNSLPNNTPELKNFVVLHVSELAVS